MKFILNPIAKLLKWPLMFCKDTLKTFQEEPASSLYIVIVVALFVYAEKFGLRWWFDKKSEIKLTDVLETVSVISILVGTIWTAFGVMLSPKAKNELTGLSLDSYIQFKIKPPVPGSNAPPDPVKEVVNALVVASNFATSGLFLVTLGSLGLLVKLFLSS